MLTSSELNKISVFACLNDGNLMWLLQQTANLHLEPGEYLIHEGESIPFFVVLEGTREVLKNVMGCQTEVYEHHQGDFFGELPILMATGIYDAVGNPQPRPKCSSVGIAEVRALTGLGSKPS